MSATDAFIIGESWISEHYFMSDSPKESFHARVLARRKQEDAANKAGEASTRSAFIADRRTLLACFTALSDSTDAEQLRKLYMAELNALGYSRSGADFQRDGAITRVSPFGTDTAPLWIVEAKPVADISLLLSKDAASLLEPFERDNGEKVTSVARLLSLAFVDDDAPEFALVLSGGLAMIAEQHRWAEGRYLAVDLALVCDRNDEKRGGEIDTMLACLAAESLAPNSDGNIWWQGVLKDSVAHTVGVSKDLRDAVRISIEIIGNEVVRQRQRRGLAPLPDDQAQPLAKQALRFLYRILFLLYAEASPELGVLPVGDPTYQRGYSLDRLRELTQVQLMDPHEREGTHLYESLKLLFDLVDRGYEPPESPSRSEGLTFHSLRADLFRPQATALIDAVGLSNEAMQKVLANLLLSKANKKEQRGFISYAELGINQLGEVYEGLMSYTGFFAQQDLTEVAPNGDPSKGSWVVPVSQAQEMKRKDFVTQVDPVTGEPVPVKHRRGSFVFRLSGRDRQQSASYYTPEVLTHFTVQQALEELLDQDATTPAADILRITVCEPALGSGAFAIEATRQLAEQYLQRRQKELGQTIDPDQYPIELQRAKTYIALHNVYGVDLNATAVELAEITLWLDTMARGLHAPWFGLHLRRGNSLIGCRRAVFRADQVKDGSWLTNVPRDVSLYSPDDVLPSIGNGIHYFLLPAKGWGASADAKAAKELAPDALKRLKSWRKSVTRKPNYTQCQELAVLAERVEKLWGFAVQRLTIAEAQVRRTVPVWGAAGLPEGGAVTREQIEASLADPAGAFQRLKTVMDAWNALWFWPLTGAAVSRTRLVNGQEEAERIDPPSFAEWIETLKDLLGHKPEATSTGGKRWKGGDATLASAAVWNELGAAEKLDLAGAGAASPQQIAERHPWLSICRSIAEQQGFFHWELMFGHVFHAHGGFDMQVGNPPWVRPRDDDAALLAEFDPWWQLTTKPPVLEVRRRREQLLAHAATRSYFLSASCDLAAQRASVSSPQDYSVLLGLQPDLYRCFMVQTWRHSSARGTIGLIHPETHFTDEAAGLLRQHTYRRLRRHWQFDNELMLFDIDHHVSYGVHVYGSAQTPSFIQATSLYHPDTAVRSLDHDGSGPEPGLKDLSGNWDLRPHKSRIIH
ncbi:MAG: BREX-1 system adenine-specific DNA-methyltransferase PglX, partial [Ancrocorticia sp.]|nr:BREX-1 system adenine-specific DNA-methyltransferase PglX [Ancrocorticia sp.]